MKEIEITDFAKRHFDPKFGATKILDYTPEGFMEILDYQIEHCSIEWIPGYADFCKIIIVENFTTAKLGSVPITIENFQFIRSGYFARREEELPVLSRWIEFPYPLSAPIAPYLMIIIYSKSQIDKEGRENEFEKTDVPYEPFNAKWGIVSINAVNSRNEEPIHPETMTRNMLGVTFGGSGVAISKEKYAEAVEYWNKHIIVKSK